VKKPKLKKLKEMKIILEEGQQLFFTSDTHYNHKNICRAVTSWEDADNVTRDFRSLEHMNDTIVNNINRMVGEDDILFHLGDWSFGGFEKIQEFRDKIVCKNIHLILGNHDHHIEKDKDGIRSLFSSINHYFDLEVYDSNFGKFTQNRFILCHYPISSWIDMNKGTMHLHGHVHLPPQHAVGQGKSIDVGMDGNGMEVVSMRYIVNRLKDQPIENLVLPSDHHKKEVK
jgi:calcineurin-like phosphoesterase family protein